jgi:hypothetical protein
MGSINELEKIVRRQCQHNASHKGQVRENSGQGNRLNNWSTVGHKSARVEFYAYRAEPIQAVTDKFS